MDLSNVVIKSRNPMYYINEEYQIIEFPNNYDNAEVIELKKTVGTTRIPINKRITIIVSLGLFLFRSKEDAINFGKLLDDPDLLVKNSINQGATKDNIVSFSVEGIVKSGLYTIKQFDNGLTNQLARKDYCYIDDNKEIHSIQQIEPESEEDSVVTEYVNRVSSLDHQNLSNNLIIFEILYEKGKVYITHYSLDNNLHSTKTLLITDINAYRIYKNKHSAKGWLYNLKLYGRDRELEETKSMIKAVEHAREVARVKKETAIKILKIISKFAWKYKSMILGKGLDFLKRSLNINIPGVGDVDSNIQEKILEMITKGDVQVVE